VYWRGGAIVENSAIKRNKGSAQEELKAALLGSDSFEMKVRDEHDKLLLEVWKQMSHTSAK
jgi:hypothetical protein